MYTSEQRQCIGSLTKLEMYSDPNCTTPNAKKSKNYLGFFFRFNLFNKFKKTLLNLITGKAPNTWNNFMLNHLPPNLDDNPFIA